MLNNIKDGWGTTIAGVAVLVFIGYQVYLDPKSFSLGDVLGALAALGLIGAPPLSKIVPPQK